MTGDSVYKSTNRNYKSNKFVGYVGKFVDSYTARGARGPVRLKFLPRKNLGGFTLMETLVALTLFSVVVTIGTDLFFTFQRVSQRTEALEAMVSTSRFIVERIAREVREGTINYESYTVPITGPQSTLNLSNSAGEPITFAYNDDTANLVLIIPTGSEGEELLPAGVRLRHAAFYVTPENDPFRFDRELRDFAGAQQPRVTLFISLDNGVEASDRNYIQYDVQTTISSRTYRR
ncbi:prepilin-type N-terminal cleavage/methylation domain-containing protein [Candidatus Uhrbacteria bacterium]|nr:prepilin-type N-terminal cleavage/methylation domain-containing protein [Candidatus Uhrbacteria bacterium]